MHPLIEVSMPDALLMLAVVIALAFFTRDKEHEA